MNKKQTSTEWVTVAATSRLHEAHMLKAVLEEEGMPVFLKDEETAGTYANPNGMINVQVPNLEAEKAYNILSEGGFLP